MNKAQHVTNLDISRKLKKLGVSQDTLLYWDYIDLLDSYELFTQVRSTNKDACSAYTLGELLNFFYPLLKNNDGEFYPELSIDPIIGQWIFILDDHDGHHYAIGYGPQLVNKIAELLITLIENNKITILVPIL
jgi:hypothetical protein